MILQMIRQWQENVTCWIWKHFEIIHHPALEIIWTRTKPNQRQLTCAERRKLNIIKHEAGAAIEKNDNVMNKVRRYKSLIKTMETEHNQVI